MTTTDLKTQIERSIMDFSHGNLRENGIGLLKSLGYMSDRQVIVEPNTFEGFVEIHPPLSGINKQKALVENWLSVDILFQLTGEDLKQMTQGRLIFDKNRIDNHIIESYLFLAIELKQENYSRTKLADITREVNKFFAMPVMILFEYGEQLTLSIINRRLHKKDESKDVLEKVTLIKGISITNPIRAHLEILFDLSLAELEKSGEMHGFVELHNAWQKTLDISELNKRFYREIADWYFYAVEHVEFPKGTTEDRQTRNATNIIRLITRLIFVWFIKEKGLVPETLFNLSQLKEILNFNDPQNSSYYKAILQNLFFATLNTEMGPERRFRGKNKNPNGLDAHHGISTVYRYEDFFRDPAKGLALFVGIPFLNGGLFECLDKREEKILVDGFSDDPRNQPVVPDSLFFGDELTVDLSEVYGDKHHNKEKVRGLIRIFDSYKFTIEENTPLDEEIALDPELLGKVFENLLAAYNPETGTTARKQTGSFYTPREIVNYMVDESLIAYLENSLGGDKQDTEEKSLLESNLRDLLAYNNDPHKFTGVEADQIISAIDKVKVLDPACGSGAFPMGVLHKLVFILNKLDPGNGKWKERQMSKAAEIPDSTVRDQVIEDIEKSFSDNELDYGRKLYLIENCIYGVDIQPIAVQIAKLRFFISLVVDQSVDRLKINLGIRPLPNLESKFVAANTLIGIEKPQQLSLHNPAIDEKEKELAGVRDSLFTARTPATKRKYREIDKKLRDEITFLLINDGWSNDSANQLSNWDPYDQNTSAGFFDPEWMFGVSMNTSETGFDIVIGNPPYGANFSKDIQKKIKNIFETPIGEIDSYTVFIEKACNLLRTKGMLAYIIPDTWLTTITTEKLRRWLLEKYHLSELVMLNGLIFQEGVVDTMLLFVRKQQTDSSSVTTIRVAKKNQIVKNISSLPITAQKNQTLWLSEISAQIKVFVIQEIEEILIKISKDSTRLEELVDYRAGCKPYEEGKGVPPQTKATLQDKPFTSPNKKNEEWLPLLRGNDIQRYLVSSKRPEWIKYGAWLAAPRKMEVFSGPRILVQAIRNPSLAERIIAAKTDETFITRINVYSLLSKSMDCNLSYILAILNSKLMNWYLKRDYGLHTYIITGLMALPIKTFPNRFYGDLIRLADQILTSKHTNPLWDTSMLEGNLDRLVYELYGLTDEEIAIVEGNSKETIKTNPSLDAMTDEIIDDLTEPIEIIEIPIQSDYDLYKCGQCGKLVIGHDRENHSREVHHSQSDWDKLKK